MHIHIFVVCHTTDNLLGASSSRREEWSEEEEDDTSQAENYEILVCNNVSIVLFYYLTSGYRTTCNILTMNDVGVVVQVQFYINL